MALRNTLVASAILVLLAAVMKEKWYYYLRDDALVFRANAWECEFFGIVGWEASSRFKNAPELLQTEGNRIDNISARKAKILIST